MSVPGLLSLVQGINDQLRFFMSISSLCSDRVKMKNINEKREKKEIRGKREKINREKKEKGKIKI